MRVSRKSMGGISCTSAEVQTAITPGIARTASLLIPQIRPWAWAERTMRMWSICAKVISAAKRPLPVSSGRSSRRGTERPISPISSLRTRGRAQRRTNALRSYRKFINRDPEWRERIIDGIDHRGRSADCSALAEAFSLGDRFLCQRLKVMDLDCGNLPSRRRQVICKRGGEDIPGIVIDDLFQQRVGNP